MPKKGHLRLYVGVLEWWLEYKLRWALEEATSPMFAKLERAFVNGRDPSLSTIRGHLYHVAGVD